MIFSKKTILAALFSVAATLAATAQNLTREEYIDRYKHIAVDHMERYGIPASITLAQGILESSNGNSRLARQANNHFGIKCHSDWDGETIYHDDDARGECFRKYDNAEQSYEDHAEFLSSHRQRRYDSLFVYDHTDYRNWARGLKAAGYATAPDYAERLIKIIEDNNLYLFDSLEGEGTAIADNGNDRSLDGETPTAPAAAGVGCGVDPDKYRVTINSHGGYNVYRINGTCYVIAKNDDTYENISSVFRVSALNLRKFNETEGEAQPAEGDVVYIERKPNRWEGSELLHTVTDNEQTLLDIAQNYGIRLKALARLNKTSTDARFGKGRTVKIR